jgi:hypothetical protein
MARERISPAAPSYGEHASAGMFEKESVTAALF